MSKGLIAQLALVRSLASMSISMQFQIYGRFEPGVAVLALETVLSSILIWTTAFPRRASTTSFHEPVRIHYSLNVTSYLKFLIMLFWRGWLLFVISKLLMINLL